MIYRFIEAQSSIYPYERALEEIRNGYKQGHWIWFIFPMLKGLGKSNMSEYYGIRDLEEAKEYLNDPILGARLREITSVLLDLPTSDARSIFSSIDSIKFRSCMTLFYIAGQEEIFQKVLNKYYNGKLDQKTLAILEIYENLDI